MADAKEFPQKALQKALEIALHVNRKRARKYVAKRRRAHPQESPRRSAELIIRRVRWFGAGVGGATGVAANPWAAVPMAVADAGVLLNREVDMAYRIALLYDPTYFDDDDDEPWELLVPIFGGNAGSQFLREGAVLGSMGVTRAAVKQYLSKDTLRVFRRVMLKYFGLKVGQKAVITKTIPVIGGVIGAGWNYKEVSAVGHRVIEYMEDRVLDVDDDDSEQESHDETD